MSKNKSKAFFYMGSWYHRTKILRADFSIGYSKKGGFKTQQEAEKSYFRMLEEFEREKKKWNPCVDKNILLADYLKYWFNRIHVPTVDSATRMIGDITLNNYILPHTSDIPLRMCNATLLLKADLSVKAISDSLGHAKTIISVDVYGDKCEIIADCVNEIQPFIDKVMVCRSANIKMSESLCKNTMISERVIRYWLGVCTI